ncbi:4Fe-4S single cluster domain-containing protein [Fusobacterium sp. MFO224]|uniref:4Fe-4S single cluster domain-containing protein n=1 Tax=Fusobacterium sp. MFO224 TaxID=3378070 RepID=UPI003851947A
MNINSYENSSFIYGPGERFIIWTQGCSIRCKGCWNEKMHSFKKVNEIGCKELLKLVVDSEVKGVTFLGGEPFDQYKELLEIAKKLYELNISVIIFSGYEKFELIRDEKNEIFKYIDILIYGRYVESKRNINLQWRGSENQVVDFLSDRYSEKELIDGNYVEIIIENDGSLKILGFPEKIEELVK